MRLIRRGLARLLGSLGLHRDESDFADELKAHLEMEVDNQMRRGLSPDQARRAAALRFGGLESVKEGYRDQRGLPIVENLMRDLRYAIRALRRTPAFTAVAVLTVAVGVGVNTAVFSVVSAVMLRPLPYAEPDRLVSLWEVNTARGHRLTVSPANLANYRAQNQSFTNIAGYTLTGRNLTEAGPPDRIWAQQATANLFSLLGVRPAIGREFRVDEDRRGGQRVVIISHELWEKRLGTDPNILGRTLRLGRPASSGSRCHACRVPGSQSVSAPRADLAVPTSRVFG